MCIYILYLIKYAILQQSLLLVSILISPVDVNIIVNDQCNSMFNILDVVLTHHSGTMRAINVYNYSCGIFPCIIQIHDLEKYIHVFHN